MSSKQPQGTQLALLILLFFITVTQFATWGKQSVEYVLAMIFNVSEVLTTPIDMIIGLTAMVASALIFVASFLWWSEKIQAKQYFIAGTVLFLGKNILDIINTTIVFSIKYKDVEKTASDISVLSANIGWELFQFAFWIFILFYFRHKIQVKEALPSPNTAPEANSQ